MSKDIPVKEAGLEIKVPDASAYQHVKYKPEDLDKRYDNVIMQLLDGYGGVFLGEQHNIPAVQQTITMLMPRFKARGDVAIAIELPQDIIDELGTIKTEKELAAHVSKDYGAGLRGFREAWHVIHAAKQHGVPVIGYEHPDVAQEMKDIVQEARRIGADKTLNEAERFEKIMDIYSQATRGILDYDKITKRDAYGAAHIREKAQGRKVIVIGGKLHSASYAVGEESTEGRSNTLWNREMTPIAEKGYRGLDQLLGFPSIDYVPAASSEEVGKIKPGDGKASNYDIPLPDFVIKRNPLLVDQEFEKVLSPEEWAKKAKEWGLDENGKNGVSTEEAEKFYIKARNAINSGDVQALKKLDANRDGKFDSQDVEIIRSGNAGGAAGRDLLKKLVDQLKGSAISLDPVKDTKEVDPFPVAPVPPVSQPRPYIKSRNSTPRPS